MKYKKIWLGKCINNDSTFNLKIGETYLLKDQAGDKSFVIVSRHISNSDSFIGGYHGKHFEFMKDLTEVISSLPFQKVAVYDRQVHIVQMIARQEKISIREAQDYCKEVKILKEDVVDDEGNPLRGYPDMYSSREEIDQSTFNTNEEVDDGLPEMEKIPDPDDLLADAIEVDETMMHGADEAGAGSSQSNKADKPKTSEKPKFVQRGLFG